MAVNIEWAKELKSRLIDLQDALGRLLEAWPEPPEDPDDDEEHDDHESN